MAPPPGTLRVGRYFLALFALMVLLYLLVFLPGERHTPKLGLDLVGGQQVTFQAKAPKGKTPTASSMQQAKQIIEQRVNGSGVTEATVVIQGADQLVVSIPGGTRTDVTKLGAAAVLNFRPLVAPAQPVTCGKYAPKAAAGSGGSGAPGVQPSTSPSTKKNPAVQTSGAKPSPNDAGRRPIAAPTSSAAKSGGAKAPARTSPGVPTASAPTSAAQRGPTKCLADPMGVLLKADKALKVPLSDTEFGTLGTSKQQEIAAGLSNFDCAAGQNEPDIKSKYFVACGTFSGSPQQYAYLLGPVVVPGNQISDANAQAPNAAGGVTEWTVQLKLKTGGDDAWSKYTGAHNIGGKSSSSGASSTNCSTSTYPCADFVAFTLDGRVITAPVNEGAINGGTTQITGSFTQNSANQLSDQLRYGALPLSFTSQQAQTVSATLGTSQLKAALLAGGIGLILVIVYSMFYYRALGLVTIASLVVSGGLTYAMLVVLGTQIGFTLSLAGIAGFIVAVGITADSFVVFFERIKDEVHEGRSVRVAVPRAWVRARRTVLSADTVSFLAAAILYYFAAGDVKGFAFTLGLSTLLDVLVVFWFTHPLVSVLSRSTAFGSARFTGLNSVRAGGITPDEPERADRSARGSRSRPPAKGKRAGTAVLDRPKVTAEPQTDIAEDDGAEKFEESEDDTAQVKPGTAAERAAARRARMREQRDSAKPDENGGR